MPILKNAKKALRSSKRKAGYNQPIRARLKTTLKKLVSSKSDSDLGKVYAAADKAVKKHVIHKNKANRLKRQAAKLLAVKTPAKVVKTPAKPAKSTTKAKSAVKKKK